MCLGAFAMLGYLFWKCVMAITTSASLIWLAERQANLTQRYLCWHGIWEIWVWYKHNYLLSRCTWLEVLSSLRKYLSFVWKFCGRVRSNINLALVWKQHAAVRCTRWADAFIYSKMFWKWEHDFECLRFGVLALWSQSTSYIPALADRDMARNEQCRKGDIPIWHCSWLVKVRRTSLELPMGTF